MLDFYWEKKNYIICNHNRIESKVTSRKINNKLFLKRTINNRNCKIKERERDIENQICIIYQINKNCLNEIKRWNSMKCGRVGI